MLDETNVYALDEGKNSWLTMSKEQILTAIMQAVNEGTIGNIDAGFVTKLQEMNNQNVVKFWLGTMTQFEALTEKDENTLYIFTDDPTLDDIESNFDDVNKKIDDIVKGETTVDNAAKVNGLEITREDEAVIADDNVGHLVVTNTKYPRKEARYIRQVLEYHISMENLSTADAEIYDGTSATRLLYGRTFEITIRYAIDVGSVKKEFFRTYTFRINKVSTSSYENMVTFKEPYAASNSEYIAVCIHIDESGYKMIGTAFLYGLYCGDTSITQYGYPVTPKLFSLSDLGVTVQVRSLREIFD